MQSAQNNVLSADAAVQAAQANVDRTQAALADSQKSYDRTKQLVDAKVAAAMDLQTAQAALDQAAAAKQQAIAQVNQAKAQAQAARSQVAQAQAQAGQAKAAVDLAQVNMDHTIIKAPIDGVVVARNVDVGQTVAASLQAPVIFLIANDLTRMQVLANIDEADVGQLAPGSDVSFHGGRLSSRPVPRQGVAGAAGADDRAERGDLHGGDRRRERRSQAEAGHDGECHGDRRRSGRTC